MIYVFLAIAMEDVKPKLDKPLNKCPYIERTIYSTFFLRYLIMRNRPLRFFLFNISVFLDDS